MDIIINRGFELAPAKTLIFKNQQLNHSLPATKDHCKLNVNIGDNILIKFSKSPFYTLKITDFCYKENIKFIFITQTKLCKIWELFNYKILPYFCLVLLIFNNVIFKSELYSWISTITLIITALSLMGLQAFILFPTTRKKIYSLHIY